jgi:hypothetical protein
MFANLVDHTSLCSQRELFDLVGPEDPLTPDLPQPPPPKSEKQLIEEWKRAGPRPRPLPPPPARPFYAHEKEGWYGWIGENDTEPDASLISGGKHTGCSGMHLIILFLLKLMPSSPGFTMTGVVGQTTQVWSWGTGHTKHLPV